VLINVRGRVRHDGFQMSKALGAAWGRIFQMLYLRSAFPTDFSKSNNITRYILIETKELITSAVLETSLQTLYVTPL
jgi:hypothetical protein